MIDEPASRILDPARLAAVRATGLLDTEPEEAFDDLARLAAVLLDAPYAFVTLVDEHRSYWKSRIGLGPDAPTQNTVDESFCQYVVSSSEPLMVGDAAANPITAGNPSIEAMGVAAWAGFPLTGPDGSVLGSFCVVDEVVREWRERDAEVLRVLARAAAREIALRTADAAQRDAARQRDHAAARLQLLGEVSHEMTETLDVEQAVARLVRLVVPVLGDWSVVSIVGDHAELHDVGWWHADEKRKDAVSRFARSRLIGIADRGATHEVRRSTRPVVVTSGALDAGLDVLRSEQAREAWIELNPGSYVVFPLVAGTSIAGTLAIMRDADRPVMSGQDLELGLALAHRAGLALGNAQLYAQQKAIAVRLREANARITAASAHDRAVSRALQDAMLTRLPEPRDAELAARYLTADEADQVGGDWYDAVLGPAGALTLVIGDVAGHDIAAASVMGQLRNLLRAFVWNDPDETPAALIASLDHAMHDLDVATMTTLAVVRIAAASADDPSGRRAVRWSCAGHPPPLVARPDGRVEAFSGAPDIPLGIDRRAQRHDHETWIEPGSNLLLYTDGLVETRQPDQSARVQQLRTSFARNLDEPIEALLDHVLEHMVGGQPTDDVAVLAARFHAPTGQAPTLHP